MRFHFFMIHGKIIFIIFFNLFIVLDSIYVFKKFIVKIVRIFYVVIWYAKKMQETKSIKIIGTFSKRMQ